jgi:hypothetical protein
MAVTPLNVKVALYMTCVTAADRYSYCQASNVKVKLPRP